MHRSRDEYMAPELLHVLGKPQEMQLDHQACDMYALGVIIYKMLYRNETIYNESDLYAMAMHG